MKMINVSRAERGFYKDTFCSLNYCLEKSSARPSCRSLKDRFVPVVHLFFNSLDLWVYFISSLPSLDVILIPFKSQFNYVNSREGKWTCN